MQHSRIVTILLTLSAVAFAVSLVRPQTSNPLIDELKSPNADVRARAARELGKSADPSAVPALATAVTDPSEKVRSEVIVALSSIRVPESLDPLIVATRDTDSKVRALAVQGLVGHYTGQTPSIGFAGFWKKTWRRTRDRFVEENIRIDPGVEVEPKVTSALIETMNDVRAIEASRQAASALGVLMAQAAVPDLVKAAYSSDKEVALEALNALGKIKDLSAGPQLVNLLDSPTPEVKQEAAVTVGVLRTGEALPKLQAMFENNPDKRIRQKALEGLAYLGNPVSVPLFTRALLDPEGQMRTSAAEGLARAGEARALPELERAVQVEKDGSARLAMQFAITALGKADFLSAVVNELGSRLRGDSAQSYLIELARDRANLARLYPYINSQDSTVRRRLCTVLMFTGDQTSIEHLEHLSRDPNGDVATEALRALRALHARLPASTPAPGPGGHT